MMKIRVVMMFTMAQVALAKQHASGGSVDIHRNKLKWIELSDATGTSVTN